MGGTIIFIFGIVFALVGIALIIGGISRSEGGVAAIGFAVALLLGGGLIVGSMVGTVGTKKVGVVTSFKKPTGETRDAGGYMIAPWKSVTEMDAAWQTASYQLNDVQAAGGATVSLDIRPRWRMIESAAPELFQNYKSFDGVVDNLFKTELVDASQNLFGSYNPLTAYDVKTSLPIKSKEKWSQELLAELTKRLSGKIEFDRLSITTISPDKASQDKLNGQLAEFGRGKILDQQSINADKEKAITDKNAKVDKAARCLEISAQNGTDPGLCGLFENKGNAGVLVNTGGNKNK